VSVAAGVATVARRRFGGRRQRGTSPALIVSAIDGEQTELLTSAIGAYTGQRPLVVQGPVSFQVTADGSWTLRVQPMSSGGSPAFNGTGDAVSA